MCTGAGCVTLNLLRTSGCMVVPGSMAASVRLPSHDVLGLGRSGAGEIGSYGCAGAGPWLSLRLSTALSSPNDKGA